jgi:hypothetical protein
MDANEGTTAADRAGICLWFCLGREQIAVPVRGPRMMLIGYRAKEGKSGKKRNRARYLV